MGTSRDAAMLLAALFLLLIHGGTGNKEPGRFAIPFELDGNMNPVYGDTKYSDDENVHKFTFPKEFPFDKTSFRDFYINPNGAIRTRPVSRINFAPFGHQSVQHSDILVFAKDVELTNFCHKTDKSCGIFYRSNIDDETKMRISNLINKKSRISFFKSSFQNKIPDGVKDFIPDKDLTLVVTWYKVPQLSSNHLRNSFQAVITSDGDKSYAIFSYNSLTYPHDVSHPFKAGIQFGAQNEYCKMPVGIEKPVLPTGEDVKELYCQSNTYERGTYVFGLTKHAIHWCGDGENVLSVTCADCTDDTINKRVNEKGCSATDNKVCGRDGVTYNNMCELRVAACSAFADMDNNVTLLEAGKCYESPCNVANDGCEDKCVDENRQARCVCSAGKNVKSDGKSCDWSGYFYSGFNRGFSVVKGKDQQVVEDDGNVLAMASDYKTNTLFFSTEENDHGMMKYKIKMYRPARGSSQIILDETKTGGKVVNLVFDPNDSSLYYATMDGHVKQITNMHSASPKVKDMHKLSSVSGMMGEGCQGYMFMVDDKAGKIFRISDTEPERAIVTGLDQPSGLAIDYMNHKLYWSSNSGIEESNYDGSCRRNMSTRSMQNKGRQIYMYFLYDTLYFTEGDASQSTLRSLNVKNGIETVISTSANNPICGIGMIWPDTMWSENRIKSQSPYERPMGRLSSLGKEFRIQFNISATADPQSILNLTRQDSETLLSVSYSENMLRIHFNTSHNFTIPIKSDNKMHMIEIGQSREEQGFFFYIRKNNELMHSVQNDGPKDYRQVQYAGADHSKLKALGVSNRVSNPFCPIKMTCRDQCEINNGGCEDQCVSTAKGPMCKCTDDKMLKRDGKSCDWREYFFIGGHNKIYLANQFRTHTMNATGEVTAVATDYSSNSLFYATMDMKNGAKEYSIHAFKPPMSYRVVVDKSRLTDVVTSMMYAYANMTIYYSSGGKVYELTNMFEEQANVKEMMDHHFGMITGMAGEPCQERLFLMDSDNGKIYGFNETTAEHMPVVISGLRNAKGLAIDYGAEMLYWYSDVGIEESTYDGSCRRLVAKKSSLHGVPSSMVFTDALYWTNEMPVHGKYYLMRTDIKTGVTTMTPGSSSPTPLTSVYFIYPEHRWNEEKRKLQMGGLHSEKMAKEFDVRFNFKSDSDHNALSMTSSDVSDFNKPGLTVFFSVNGMIESHTIPTRVGVNHFIEISQERSGPTFHFMIKLDNEIVYIAARNHSDHINVYFKTPNITHYDNIVIRTKVLHEQCRNHKTCPVYCADNSCEDKCFTSYDSYPPQDKCQCSDGKPLKPDMRSCDWSGYMYMGGNYFFTVVKGNISHVIYTAGIVSSMEHDFSRNTFYYVVEQEMGGRKKYSLESYSPRENNTRIIDDMHGHAGYLTYDMFTKDLYFAVGPSIRMVKNVSTAPTIEQVYNFTTGNITGMQGEACDRTFFVVIREEGVIHRIYQDGTSEPAVSGLQNPHGLAIDYVNHKLYWTSDLGLEESNYNGTCRRTIKTFGNGFKPRAIHHIGRSIVWSNTTNSTIAETNIDTGKTKYTYMKSAEVHSVGWIYDPMMYPDVCPVTKKHCDIGNCSINNNGCEEKCVTMAGKAKCVCRTGKLKPDQKSCDFSEYMIYARNDSVMLASTTDYIVEYPTNGSEIYAVEFDYERNHIFYSYSKENNFHLAMFNTSGSHEDLVNLGDGKVNYLAYDFNSSDMYVSTDKNVTVYRDIYSKPAAGDGELLKTGATNGIAFEPCRRNLYMICQKTNKLQMWNSTSSSLEDIIELRSHSRALTIDTHAGKLYFFKERSLIEVNYDGTCMRTIDTFSGGFQPYGLEVYAHIGLVYMSDTSKRENGYTLWNATFKDTTPLATWTNAMPNYDIKSIFNRRHAVKMCPMLTQERKCSACVSNKGGCEDKCIPDYMNGEMAKCHCSIGKLKADGKSCNYTGYTVYGLEHGFSIASLDNILFVEEKGMVMGVEFDYETNSIYYTVGSKIKMWTKNDSSSDVVEISRDFGRIERLARDWNSQEVYFTTKHHLHMMLGEKPMNVSYFGRVSGLAYDPCSKKVFVTCSASNALYEWHHKSGLKAILTGLHNPQALGIDLFEKQLYFFENDRITQTNYVGSCKNTIAKDIENAKPYALQVFGPDKYMFWTDVEKKSDGNYYIMTTGFDGKTIVSHKDPYLRNGLITIFDRKLTSYTCKMGVGKCVYGACKYDNGGCESGCVSSGDGKHRCTCEYGVLRPDFKRCDYTNYVVRAVGNKIIMNGTNQAAYVHHASSETRGVAFDFDTNTIYFSIAERKSSWQKSQILSFDSSGQTKVILTSDFEVTHLVYDSATRNLYYSTPYHLRMVNMYYPVPIKLEYFAHITGLAFDRCERKVFVTSQNGVMVWQEGKGKSRLPITVGMHAAALAIDEVKHKLYIYHSKNGIIQTNYDGSCQKFLSHHHHPENVKPYGMVYIPHGDYLMWSTSMTNSDMYSVMSTSVQTGMTKMMTSARQMTYGLTRIYDRKVKGSCPAEYRCGGGACENNNGGCEQICALGKGDNAGKPECHCRYGGQIRKDGKTCDYSNIVYAASGRYLIFRHGKNLEKASIFHTANEPISAIAHRPDTRGIFFAVKHHNGGSSIHYKEVNANMAKLISRKHLHILSMEYDQQKHALYYSMSNGEIQRMHNPLMEHRHDEHLLRAGMPSDIRLSYCKRELIYVDNINKIGRVYRIKENDRMPELVTYGPGLFGGLALDRKRNMIYWKNEKEHSIREATSGNCDREVVRVDHVKFMVFRDMHLFYADGNGHIKMVNVRNGERASLQKTSYPITGGMRLFDRVTDFPTHAGNTTTPTPTPTSVPMTTVTPSPATRKDYVEGKDGRHYKFHATLANWSSAEAICNSEGAHLAIIETAETYEYITEMMNSKKYTNWIWIGGHDENSNNNWKWVNGMNVEKTYWSPGEPNNYNEMNEDCMAIFPLSGALFYDVLCSQQSNFLCEKGGFHKGPDGYRYMVHRESSTWHGAKATCEAAGAHLAIIDNQKTFEYMSQIARKSNNWIWIGGHDQFSNNTWKWVNGKHVEKKYWQPGEPNNYNGLREDCMAIYPATGAMFYDAYCKWEEPIFVCQMEDEKSDSHNSAEMRDGYKQGYDGNYYKYFAEPKTWNDAQAHCVSDNATLAMHQTDHVYMYMRQNFPSNYWVGVRDHGLEGLWTTVNGKAVEKPNWGSNVDESMATNRDCGFMTNEGKWNQAECYERKPYLCQKAGSFEKCGGAQKCQSLVLYRYGHQYGDNSLPRGDEKYAHLHFEQGIPFFSRKKTDIYIHTNGHLTADRPDGRWTHSAKSEIPVAAVYMMDLTTEDGGDVFYRVTTDKTVLDRIAFETSRYPTLLKEYKEYLPCIAMIVTWHEVAVKGDPMKKLTFQLVYHTDGKISATNTIYGRLDASGGMTGYSENKCNQLFNTEMSRKTSMNLLHSSNIGVNGIYLGQVYKPECGIKMVSEPIEVKYMETNPSVEAVQRFYFNGKNRITNVFTQSYTWEYVSTSFVTGVVIKQDEIQVKYIYYSNAPFSYKWGVSTLILRDNVDKKYLRNGNMELSLVERESKCHYQEFEKSMDKSPCILLNTMIHSNQTNPLNGLSNVWLHNVSHGGFHVCYRGMVDFWGPRKISVDYLAVTRETAAHASEMSLIEFSHHDHKRNGVFCKAFEFKHAYPEAPAVFVTPEVGDSSALGGLLAWVKDVKRYHALVCAKNLDMDMSSVKIHCLVYQKMDKCSHHRCPSHLECHLDENNNPSCGCKRNCTQYPQETFCASNLHTYKSQCEMDKHMCEMKIDAKTMNIKKIYDGECKQYPYQSGMTQLQSVKALKSAFCEHVELDSTKFHNNTDMKILLTVSWNQTSKDKEHDASASWTEDVTTSGFKACVMVAGRHFFDDLDPPSVHWVAFQSGVATATAELEVGTVNMKTWYTGSRCHFIKLEKNTPETKILVSVEHGESRVFTNAMTAWVEKGKFGNRSSHHYKVCARELQNFDGIHKDVKIHYMAIHHAVDKYIVEPNEIIFERHHFSRDQPIPPVCKTVKFNYNFPILADPTVILTAVNVSNMHMNSVFSLHDIAVWSEGNNDTHLTVCFKSLRAGLYREEVMVQYAIWPKLCGDYETYYDGKCYRLYADQEATTSATAEKFCDLPDSKMSASKAYFFGNRFGINSPLLMKKNDKGKCLFNVDKDGISVDGSATSVECDAPNNRSFVCEKDREYIKNACHCMNGGTCVKHNIGQVECKCSEDYRGERCEKRIRKNCMHYKNVTESMAANMRTGVWYRYPGRKMVEYCPRRRGCASIDDTHPHEREGVVTRNLIYGSYPSSAHGRCAKGYGTVMIQNCGNYYVYNLHVAMKELGTNLCFERHVM